MRTISKIAKFTVKAKRWAEALDWSAIAQATIPLVIAGLLLRLLGAV